MSRSASGTCSSTAWIVVVDEAELDHRAIVLDEAGVRGAAAGGHRRPPAGDGLDRLDHGLDQRAGLGQEDVAGAGEGELVARVDARRGRSALLAQPGLDRRARVQVSL